MSTQICNSDTLMTDPHRGRSSRDCFVTVYYFAACVLLGGTQTGLASDLATAHGTVAV